MTDIDKNYLVLLTSGSEDGGKRATLAFCAACSAVALNKETQVFLVGDGGHWAYEGSADCVNQEGFPPLKELIQDFLELGGKIYICTTCERFCAISQDGPEAGKAVRKEEIQPRGFSAVLGEMAGAASLTF